MILAVTFAEVCLRLRCALFVCFIRFVVCVYLFDDVFTRFGFSMIDVYSNIVTDILLLYLWYYNWSYAFYELGLGCFGVVSVCGCVITLYLAVCVLCL